MKTLTRHKTSANQKAERSHPRANEVSALVCVLLLLIILALGGGYVLFIFRDTTVSKMIVFGLVSGLTILITYSLKIGPFKHHH